MLSPSPPNPWHPPVLSDIPVNPSTLAHTPAAVPLRGTRPAPPQSSDAWREPTDLSFLKKVLWFYLAVWLVEGSLRKWVLPGLSTPLLIIRDPILLYIYYLAFTKGVFPKGVFVTSVIVLGAVALLVSVAATDTPLLIELYGLRASYLHMLLIFLIPNVFDLDDVRWLGKWTLLAAVPMALLVFLQFLAGRGSWLNAGAGGTTNGMIEAAYGHIRPSGTFSFTTGLTGFTAMTAVFFLYHLLEQRVYPRLIWLAAAPALVVLVILSGSRTAAGLVFIIMSALIFVGIVHRRYRPVTFKLAGLVGLLMLLAGSFAVFKQGMEVFAYRFGNASNVRVGFIGRFFDTLDVPFQIAERAPAFGCGLGMGTNAAGGLLLGHSAFLLTEGELGRDIMESGPLVGGLYLSLRACIAVYLCSRALRSLFRDVNPLPLLLFSGCFVDLCEGQFSQPTELGYATIACGLCLAANRPGAAVPLAAPAVPAVPPLPPSRRVEVVKPIILPAPPAPKPAAVRGRSTYAERLHGRSAAPEPPADPAGPTV